MNSLIFRVSFKDKVKSSEVVRGFVQKALPFPDCTVDLMQEELEGAGDSLDIYYRPRQLTRYFDVTLQTLFLWTKDGMETLGPKIMTIKGSEVVRLMKRYNKLTKELPLRATSKLEANKNYSLKALHKMFGPKYTAFINSYAKKMPNKVVDKRRLYKGKHIINLFRMFFGIDSPEIQKVTVKVKTGPVQN